MFSRTSVNNVCTTVDIALCLQESKSADALSKDDHDNLGVAMLLPATVCVQDEVV